MSTLREKIHELGNWHNKISMASMVTNESMSNALKMSDTERIQAINKAIERLNKIEKYVVEADKIIEEVKPFIYEEIGADAKVPTKKK